MSSGPRWTMDLPGQLQSALGSAYRIERPLGRGGMATVWLAHDREEAKRHFANVVRWWRGCDPELVPLREEAREALARLTAEPVASRAD